MKSKTEELLNLLCWACDIAANPTFRNLTGSFESWAYRTNIKRQLRTLAQDGLVETSQDASGDRLHRLTEAGRALALGVPNPPSRWKRTWDGIWRMVLFDVPQSRESDRAHLRRALATRGFGCLQKSVWITPDPLAGEREALGTTEVDVESLILLDVRPCAGESSTQIVEGAWDFDVINASYARHANIIARVPKQPIADEAAARRLQRWFREERIAWKETMSLDPLLPEVLLPSGYPGMKAWKQRLEVLARTGALARSFQVQA